MLLDEAAEAAARISPLSPVASRIAFERAVWNRSTRDALVARERAVGYLWSVTRFADVMGIHWLAERSRALSGDLSAAAIDDLRKSVETDRLLRFRFRHVGTVDETSLRSHGVSGPALAASIRRNGDVLSRLIVRLEAAAADLRAPDSQTSSGPVQTTRGDLYVDVRHDGRRVEDISWRAPSAPLIDLIPEIVRGQPLADAEAIIASLDIATAEVDG